MWWHRTIFEKKDSKSDNDLLEELKQTQQKIDNLEKLLKDPVSFLRFREIFGTWERFDKFCDQLKLLYYGDIDVVVFMERMEMDTANKEDHFYLDDKEFTERKLQALNELSTIFDHIYLTFRTALNAKSELSKLKQKESELKKKLSIR